MLMPCSGIDRRGRLVAGREANHHGAVKRDRRLEIEAMPGAACAATVQIFSVGRLALSGEGGQGESVQRRAALGRRVAGRRSDAVHERATVVPAYGVEVTHGVHAGRVVAQRVDRRLVQTDHQHRHPIRSDPAEAVGVSRAEQLDG
jgi:hypothetical protein